MMTKLFKPKVIGLAGKARSGKDTVAKLLQQHYKIETVSLAQPIRDGLSSMFGLGEEHFHGTLKETELYWLGKSPRQLMQTLATEWGRNLVHEDVWLRIAKRKIEIANLLGYHVVITDVRFENEARFIRELGNGRVWHISRDGAPSVQAHVSEAGVAFDEFDYQLPNNGTLQQLEDNALYLFEKDDYDEQ